MSIKFMLILAALLGAAHAQPSNGWPTGKKTYPWDVVGWQVCLYDKTVVNGAPILSPAQGVSLSTTVTVQQGSGWHSHDTGVGRPNLALRSVTPSNGQTGSDGCLTYRYKGPGYSGWYTIESTPGAPRFSRQGVNSYLGYFEYGLNGVERPLFNFSTLFGTDYTMFEGIHDDTRHKNAAGFTGFSRYGTFESASMIRGISVLYELLSHGFLLDLIRGSLPDGGIADNEFPSSGTYLFNPWVARSQEGHMSGVEWDIANPNIQGGSGAYDTLYTIISQYLKGCKLGKLEPTGVPIISPVDYWGARDVVHIACGAAPESVQ